MSVRIYSTTPELIGSDQHKRKVGRFEVNIGFRTVAEGRRQVRKLKFTVCGTSDAAVDAHAIVTVQEIMKNCLGQILSFRKNMGHYRQDGLCPVIPPNRRMYSILGLSTQEDGNERVNLKMYVPLADLSLAQCNSLVAAGTYGADTAQLGYVRWADQDETELEAMYTGDLTGRSVVDMTYVKSEELSPDNVSNGIADGVLDKGL